MRSQEETHDIAKAIVTRLVTNTVEGLFARGHVDLGEHGLDDDDKKEVIDDLVDVALGVDIGCLGEDQITAEFIDVLFVQNWLTGAYRDGYDNRDREVRACLV